MFPNFATTKADLVCNGILPIDQMREFQGPVGLVTQRIPQRFLERTYGITIKTRPLEEGGTGVPTAEELLVAYASARGFNTQGLGQPDQSRAARYVLKDYVNGKLPFVAPPPGMEDEARAFNMKHYSDHDLPEKRRAALVPATESLSLVGDDDDNHNDGDTDGEVDPDGASAIAATSDFVALPAGPKSQKIDQVFFGPTSNGGHVSMPFNYKYTEQGIASGADKILSGRKARTVVALENGLDPKDVQVVSGKKHFKGNKRGKNRLNAADE